MRNDVDNGTKESGAGDVDVRYMTVLVQLRIWRSGMVHLSKAVMCCNCSVISDMTQTRGDVCPACACQGQMLSLARILNPCPQLGSVTYVYSGQESKSI